jgi:hypothetical protein
MLALVDRDVFHPGDPVERSLLALPHSVPVGVLRLDVVRGAEMSMEEPGSTRQGYEELDVIDIASIYPLGEPVVQVGSVDEEH